MRLILGISGASGVIMGYYMLKALKQSPDMEVHLVITEGATLNFELETNMQTEQLATLADVVYSNGNLAASIASGSFRTDGMIVIPASMKTVAGIASGYAENLLLRAADVCLKENRKLILVPRELPLNRIHLRNIKECADCGCTIIPPMLTFYNGLDTLEKQINHIVGKILMQFGIDFKDFIPWKGETIEDWKEMFSGRLDFGRRN
jgi:4-hydroxy-3-polyprenylbenzoate decarboxylase